MKIRNKSPKEKNPKNVSPKTKIQSTPKCKQPSARDMRSRKRAVRSISAQTQPIIEGKLSLETLPRSILDSIFEYVHTPDLLNLCVLSKHLYEPAVARLYKNITITSEEYAHESTEIMSHWERNFCTVVSAEKVELLYETAQKNEKLACLIESFTEAALSKYISHLLKILRLKSLNSTWGRNIPAKTIESVQRMTCLVEDANLNSTNLVELKLIQTLSITQYEDYEKLALSMIKSKSYVNLRKLVFEQESTGLFKEDYDSVEDTLLRSIPYWTEFFRVFVGKKIKLNLTGLGLCSELTGKGEDIAQLLNMAVDLSGLRTLELKHTELTASKYHNRDLPETTFVETMTKYLPSLQRLSIEPTHNYVQCQIDGLKRALKHNIPHQLKELSVKFINDQGATEHDLIFCIIMHQKNITKLKYENGDFMTEYLLGLDHIDEVEKSFAYDDKSEGMRKEFAPRVMDFDRPRGPTHRLLAERIRSQRDAIRDYLLESGFFFSKERYLPNATGIYLSGFYVNKQDSCIIAGSETIPFE
ncbi:hypothetical protein JCM33374_g5517 [Metschnikowia sp. JCM 33374]|nr:hypothetical protein JCM33374_g5517 [Metschnikowia sp. JCM 33374]